MSDENNNVSEQDACNKYSRIKNLLTFKRGIIGIIIILVVVWFLMPSKKSEIKSSIPEEDLIQRSAEMLKSEKLATNEETKDDYEFAVQNLRELFADKGYETTCFRLSAVSAYYITPAQEANGLESAYRLYIRFAIKNLITKKWVDLDHLDYYSFALAYIEGVTSGIFCKKDEHPRDVSVDISYWNGKRSFSFTDSEHQSDFKYDWISYSNGCIQVDRY